MESVARVRKFRVAYLFYRGYQLVRRAYMEQRQEILTMVACCERLGTPLLEITEKYYYILRLE